MSAYSDAVLADSPAGYWRLGDPAGSQIVDSSGNYRNGTQPGSGWSFQQPDLVPNDADGCVVTLGALGTVPYGPWMDGWTALTIELWANTSTPETVVSRGFGGSWGPFALNVDTYIRLMITNAGSIVADVRTPSNGYSTGTHHVVATYDGATVKIYVDGAQQASQAYAGGIPASSGSLNIGGVNTGAAHYFKGAMDEIAIYDHALSATRVAAHYAAANSPKTLSGVWGWVG